MKYKAKLLERILSLYYLLRRMGGSRIRLCREGKTQAVPRNAYQLLLLKKGALIPNIAESTRA